MLQLQSIGHSPFHHVFASEWNGVSLLWNSSRHNPDVIIFDASGSWGCHTMINHLCSMLKQIHQALQISFCDILVGNCLLQF